MEYVFGHFSSQCKNSRYTLLHMSLVILVLSVKIAGILCCIHLWSF